MTFYADTPKTNSKRSLLNRAQSHISAAFSSLMAGQNRTADVELLENLSDRQLADIGMVREHIVRDVYSSLYYI